METPAWFTEALAQEPERHVLDVDGVAIHYRAWGTPGDPVTVLVHGGAAHGGWWDHVGPQLAGHERVVAPDLSGHGDSGRREEYTLEDWAREVVTVARAETAADGPPPVVLGHSMGGFVALTAARDHGHELGGALAIDSPVRQLSPEAREYIESGRPVPGGRVHPDRESILARFRTLPADDSSLDYVTRHVAEGSVHEVEGGWGWKFDPRTFLSSRMEPEELTGAGCRVALLRGERGMATTDITDVVAERLGGHVPVTLVRDCGHHIMLDQPLTLVAVLQTLVGEWRRP